MSELLAPPGPGHQRGDVSVQRVEISIVIAAYEAERTLAAAIESALDQVPGVAEIVVVDDGSSDRTRDVARSYGAAVRLVANAHGGEARTKNAGVREARSAVVGFLDADDVLLPGWAQAVMTAFHDRSDVTLVTTDAWLVYEGERVRRVYDPSFRFAVENQRKELLRRNFVLGLCAVRRDRFLASGGFDERVEVASDWSAWLRLVLDGGVLSCVPEPLAEYRLHGSSLSADSTRLLRGRVDVLSRTAEDQRLTGEERGVLVASLAEQRRRLQVAEARRAIQARAPHARRMSLRLALDARHSRATRVKALSAGLLPWSVTARWVDRGSHAAGFRGGSAVTCVEPNS